MSASEQGAAVNSGSINMEERNSRSPLHHVGVNRSLVGAEAGAMETCSPSSSTGRPSPARSSLLTNNQQLSQPVTSSTLSRQTENGVRQARSVCTTTGNFHVDRGVTHQLGNTNPLACTSPCMIVPPPIECPYFTYYVEMFLYKICILPDGSFAFCRNPSHYGLRLNYNQRQMLAHM